MKEAEKVFLGILKNAVKGKKAADSKNFTTEFWMELYHLAEIHHVLPVFAETVYEVIDESMRQRLIEEAVILTTRQASRSMEFIQFYKYLKENGLRPLVMKGIICRNLYPFGEQRASVDEDLLINPEETDLYDLAFKKYGLVRDGIADIHEEHEISYRSIEKKLYIELHRYPFEPKSSFCSLNKLFEDRTKITKERIYKTDIFTLCPTEHLLYMICHAYKHFLYSGVGIRQLCDIAMFSEHYREEINWKIILEACRKYRIDGYAAGVFRICLNWLGMEFIPEGFESENTDEIPMLEDILSGGLYGASDMDRLHSSTLTMEAVSAQQEGRKTRGILKSLFPSFAYMQENYPYLQKMPFLLPAAWGQRIHSYLKDRKGKQMNPARSIEIGRQRVELLKKYNIID